jgi:membrane-bound lytic murein transglycosylase F
MIKRIRVCAILSFLLLLAACNKLEAPDRDPGSLVVAMDLELPGYFQLNDRPLGYPYELLEAYASSLGGELRVISENTPVTYFDRLSAGRIDAVAVSGTPALAEGQTFVPLYETSYVVLTSRVRARSLDARTPIYETLSGEKVLVAQGFTGTGSYDALLDSVSRSEIQLSPRNTFDLLDALADGESDFVICEQTEALVGSELFRNIVRIHTFDETVPVGVVFDGRGGSLMSAFPQWLDSYERTGEYDELRRDYFKKGLLARIHGENRPARTRGTLSTYDELFRQVAAETGVDWRMLAAVAQVESRFTPYLVSPRGARGLMQVMPAVGRSLGYDPDRLMDPETNIRAGAEVLRRIDKALKESDAAGFSDHTSLILASYNGGIGNVSDARRLAEKYGADPNSWDDVSRYLKLLADERYADDEVVRNGGFRGAGETLAFVDRVMDNYYAYSGKNR